jgi:hypothetical protein
MRQPERLIMNDLCYDTTFAWNSAKIKSLTELKNMVGSDTTALTIAVVVLVIVFVMIVIFACMGIRHNLNTTCNNGGSTSWWGSIFSTDTNVSTNSECDIDKNPPVRKRVRFGTVDEQGRSDDEDCPVSLISTDSTTKLGNFFGNFEEDAYKQDDADERPTAKMCAEDFFPKQKTSSENKAGESESTTMTYDKLVAAFHQGNGILMGQCNTRDKLRNRHSFNMGLMNREDTVQPRLDEIKKSKLDGTYNCVQFNESPLICDDKMCPDKYCV